MSQATMMKALYRIVPGLAPSKTEAGIEILTSENGTTTLASDKVADVILRRFGELHREPVADDKETA